MLLNKPKRKIAQRYLIKNEDEDYTETQTYDDTDLEEFKKIQKMDKRLNEIMKEIVVFLFFLFFLFYVAFTNLSSYGIYYNQLFEWTFVKQQNSNEIGLNEVESNLITKL